MGSANIGSIADYAVVAAPRGGELMVALRAYGDESGKAEDPMCNAVSYGAVAATIDGWKDFEAAWEKMLGDHKVPYLHMRELTKSIGPFEKWKDNAEAVKAFLTDAVSVILDHEVDCCGIAVLKSDLKRALKEKQLNSDQYAFTLYAAVSMVSTWALNHHEDDPRFQVVTDKVERAHKRIGLAEELFETDKFMAWRGWPTITPSQRSSKEVPGLQAADLVAWELRNSLNIKRKWFEEVKPLLPAKDLGAFTDSLLKYQMEAKGIARLNPANPDHRHVFDRMPLSRLRNAGMRSFLLDYERLQNHIFLSRDLHPPAADVARSIKKAARHQPCA